MSKNKSLTLISSIPLLLFVFLWRNFLFLQEIETIPVQIPKSPSVYHGELQVRKMLSDRPVMGKFSRKDGKVVNISQDDKIWSWVARAYEGSERIPAIYWDSDFGLKPSQYLSDHEIPYKDSKGLIRVRPNFLDSRGVFRDASFEELWEACVYELLNIRNKNEFINIYEIAINGGLGREEWIRRNTELEHRALLKLKHFFRDVWKPWAIKNELNFRQDLWGANVSEHYLQWIKSYNGDGLDGHYGYWGNYFDKEIRPYLAKQRSYWGEGWGEPLWDGWE